MPSGRLAQSVLRMEFIQGSTLQKIASRQVYNQSTFVLPREFYRELGRLVIVDIFMGNTDRFDLHYGMANLGNVMFDERDRQLHPIDQVCPLFLDRNSEGTEAKRAIRLLQRFAREGSAAAADLIFPLLPSIQGEADAVKQALSEEADLGLAFLGDFDRVHAAWRLLTNDASRLAPGLPRMIDLGEWRLACQS